MALFVALDLPSNGFWGKPQDYVNYKEYVTARLLELTELVQLVSQKFGLSAIFFLSFLSHLFRILLEK